VCDDLLVDPVPIANALLAGLTLLLNELRRRKGHRTPSEGETMRAALLQLESYLDMWVEQARETNALARSWAGHHRETAGGAMEMLLDSVWGQSMYSANINDALAWKLPQLIPPPLFGVDESRHPTLERLLRVYAPEFYDFLIVFSRRREQLDAMVVELEGRRAKGQDTVEEYLAELDQAAERLEEARRSLAEFIATEFPITTSE
jgi:predicted RNase H-like HicB family nuclease